VRLAVLPFDNIQPRRRDDYFSYRPHEELIARLSLVSEIELISRWGLDAAQGPLAGTPRVRHRARGARYIVGGSVRRFQDSVRITVQLVDCRDQSAAVGQHLQGQARRHLRHPEQVAQQIVEARLKSAPASPEKVRR